jgi:hypothetical protein
MTFYKIDTVNFFPNFYQQSTFQALKMIFLLSRNFPFRRNELLK